MWQAKKEKELAACNKLPSYTIVPLFPYLSVSRVFIWKKKEKKEISLPVNLCFVSLLEQLPFKMNSGKQLLRPYANATWFQKTHANNGA